MPSELSLLATASFGLESVVARELRSLGYESRAVRPGWLAFGADAAAVARANLWLRASDRVLLKLASFPSPDFGALFDQTLAVAWEEILPKNARIAVRGRSVKSRLKSVPACQKTVKKAVVERMKKSYSTDSLPEDGPLFPVEVALLEDEAWLVLDTTGPGLHRRGYRSEAGAAPLKETLAAGLVLLSGWDRERPFLDPFCGTGTLAIEAALLGRNRAPGLGRSFVSESWPFLAGSDWKRAREEARDLEKPSLPEPIEAFDRDEDVLRLARASAEKAAVGAEVRFQRRDFSETRSERDHGCLVTNPPYGDRSGRTEEVRALYRSMPEVFRRLPSWSFFVLTSRSDFERILGQEADRRRKLFNGDIECTYYQFLGPRPGARTLRAQVFGGLDERAERQAEIFANRLRKRAHHLRKWPAKRGTDCYRVYDRDIKEVPLVVDRYGEALLLTPPGDRLESRTRAEHEDWLDRMARTAADALSVPLENVFLHGRRREPRVFPVREEGLTYEVTLGEEALPGLSPVYRVLRRFLRGEARERSVLVLFSGEGSFAVAAAGGGARSTTSVDPGVSSRARAMRSFAANGIATGGHRFLQMGIEEFLDRDEEAYDLAVVLPPRLDGHVLLLRGLRDRLVSGGTVLLATTAARERLDALSDWHIEDVSASSLPEEFRSRKALRAWRLARSPAVNESSTRSPGLRGRTSREPPRRPA